MTFEGQYLTYEEYIKLGGSEIGKLPFNLLEFEARKRIDRRTFNRLKRVEEIPQDIKICEYNMINSINKYGDSTNNIINSGNIKSENIDGYSVQYLTSNEISETIKSKYYELDNIIDTYLQDIKIDDVPLLYRGVK